MGIKLHGAQAPKSRVYILTDEAERVLRLEGEYSLPADLTGWIKIDEGHPCDRLNLAQSHYFPGGLYTMDGIPCYRWDGTQAVERTEEELEADRAAIPEPKPSKTVEARLTALEAEAEQAKADREALNILLGGAE